TLPGTVRRSLFMRAPSQCGPPLQKQRRNRKDDGSDEKAVVGPDAGFAALCPGRSRILECIVVVVAHRALLREGASLSAGHPYHYASRPYSSAHPWQPSMCKLRFIEHAATPPAACRDPQGLFVLGVCTRSRIDTIGQPGDILGSNSCWSPSSHCG